MVLVESLQSFAEQAEAIYAASPLKTRYIIKYNHSKGKLTLKVSDDVTTVQFKTDQQSDLRKARFDFSTFLLLSSGLCETQFLHLSVVLSLGLTHTTILCAHSLWSILFTRCAKQEWPNAFFGQA